MRFITSIFMLLTAVSGVISAYFIGHGLVTEHSWPWLVALGLLVASALFGFVFMRLARRDPQPAAHASGGAHGHAPATGPAPAHGHAPTHAHETHGHEPAPPHKPAP